MKRYLLPFFMVAMCIFYSCSKDDSYSKLMESNLQGEILLQKLNLFEKEHTEDFRSKIDLANYFILTGDYNSCYEYLLRAESVIKNCPSGAEGKKYKTLLYGMRAQIELYSGNYELAHFYVDKAIKIDKIANKKYNYTKANIYLAQNNKEKAFELFNKTFEKIPDELTTDDKRAYMYLLADAEQYEKCRTILEDFFDDGSYFFGLGSFASGIYEKVSDYEKSILSSYFDYEYFSCFNSLDKNKFLENLDSFITGIKSPEKIFQIKDTIDFIKSRVEPSIESNYTTDFFPAKFINLSNKIRDNEFSLSDVQDFLALEVYFSDFPSYYWNAWNAFCQVDETKKKTYLPLLNKVILIGKNNLYIDKARVELGKTAGLSESDSRKILLTYEIEQILNAFNESGNESLLEPIYELLNLPENDYELNALAILKNYNRKPMVSKVFQEKLKSSHGRLQERLKYVLF